LKACARRVEGSSFGKAMQCLRELRQNGLVAFSVEKFENFLERGLTFSERRKSSELF
jgi:hypothetical protein